MAYEMVMPYHLHMPSYFLETFTEYPCNRGTISPYSNDAIRGCIRNKLNYLFIISVEKDSCNEF